MSDAAVQPVKNAAGPTDVVTNAEIFKHYFPKSFHQPPCNLSNTLNSSGEKPGKLSFIKVFEHGARTWEASGTLYMKSNLSLLPPEPTLGKGVTDVIDNKSTTKGAEVIDTLFRRGIEDGPHLEIFDRNDNIAGIVIPEDFDDVNDVGGPVKDYSPGEHDPIALFMSVDEKARTYRFGGWYKISHIAVYAKETRGVSDMLEERWALLGWDQSSKSLMAFQRECERDWARVEFTKMDPMDKNCPPPLVIGKPATRAKSTKRITSPKIVRKKDECEDAQHTAEAEKRREEADQPLEGVAEETEAGVKSPEAAMPENRQEATKVQEMVEDCKRGINMCNSSIIGYHEDFERMVEEFKKKAQSLQEDLERQLAAMQKKVAEWEATYGEQHATASTGRD